MANKKLRAGIIDLIDGQFQNNEQELNLSDSDSTIGSGHIISAKACRQMFQNRFASQLQTPSDHLNETCGYEIGKEALLLILMQQGCEGIRLVHCLNEQNEESMMVMGIMNEGSLVKSQRYTEASTAPVASAEAAPQNDPFIVERIGKVSLQKALSDFGLDTP